MSFDLLTFDIQKYNTILDRGLSCGLGKRGKQVCIEAAICETLGLAHGDDPKCVARSVRDFKIYLNDSEWSSPQARAKGLRQLGVAQLGSLEVVADQDFTNILSKKTISRLIPELFREVLSTLPNLEQICVRCEIEGSIDASDAAARAAASAARAAASATNPNVNPSGACLAADAAYFAAKAANYVVEMKHAASAACAANAAYYAEAADKAAYYAEAADKYLNLSAEIAFETLKELKSPGVQLLG